MLFGYLNFRVEICHTLIWAECFFCCNSVFWHELGDSADELIKTELFHWHSHEFWQELGEATEKVPYFEENYNFYTNFNVLINVNDYADVVSYFDKILTMLLIYVHSYFSKNPMIRLPFSRILILFHGFMTLSVWGRMIRWWIGNDLNRHVRGLISAYPWRDWEESCRISVKMVSRPRFEPSIALTANPNQVN